MHIIDRGTGSPVVLIPGAQGRWEWMHPTVDALATRCRVITFSLADEPTSGFDFDESQGVWSYVRQVRDVLEARGLREATICGNSYGGLIAAAFAARYPDRVSALVLVSAITASWQPNARQAFFLRAPRLLSPLFCVASLLALPEILIARGTVSGAAFAIRHAATVLANMFSPTLMARRARLVAALDAPLELSRVQCPTLIVTGEAALDLVVPVGMSRDYLRVWPHAESAVLERTCHLGLITKADEFARIVASFVDRNANRTSTRRWASRGTGSG